MFESVTEEARRAAVQLLREAKPAKGDIVVIGCSTSEVAGHKIGSYSNVELAEALFDGLYPVIQEHGLFLAAQCCEHLNRTLIVERECALRHGLEEVNVIPFPKAGGSFATTAYRRFTAPTAVEEVKASCGMDIGGTLIGMHLKKVAVPVRLESDRIGEARVLCARTRPKFVGGERAHYNPELL